MTQQNTPSTDNTPDTTDPKEVVAESIAITIRAMGLTPVSNQSIKRLMDRELGSVEGKLEYAADSLLEGVVGEDASDDLDPVKGRAAHLKLKLRLAQELVKTVEMEQQVWIKRNSSKTGSLTQPS